MREKVRARFETFDAPLKRKISEELQTIGWGSKQTQFQGQAGKINREKEDFDRMFMSAHSWDNHKTLIRWRADGQLLATSTYERNAANENSQNVFGRRVRIWDRDLQFLSNCDLLAGIEPTLAIRCAFFLNFNIVIIVYSSRPGKNQILTSRQLSNSAKENARALWAYEQNGQYRYNVSLPYVSNTRIEKLQWNADGSMLMALVYCEAQKLSQSTFKRKILDSFSCYIFSHVLDDLKCAVSTTNNNPARRARRRVRVLR